MQQLKNEVVQLIKHNQELSHQLDSMDIKIGLLIQNRITLQVFYLLFLNMIENIICCFKISNQINMFFDSLCV